MNICENPGFLKVLLYIKHLIDIMSIIVPAFLIVIASVDVFKAVTSHEDNLLQGMSKKMTSRAIMAVSFFFVPSVLYLLLDLAGQNRDSEIACWSNANEEKIAHYEKIEEEKRKEEEEKRKMEEEKRKAELAKKQQEEEAKRALEEAEEIEVTPPVQDPVIVSPSPGGNSSPVAVPDHSNKLVQIARLCQKEQGTPEGCAFEASLMTNLYDRYGSRYGTGIDGIYNYVKTSGWFAGASLHMNEPRYDDPQCLANVKMVLEDGLRTLPTNVIEHDCWFCNSNKCSNGNEGDICYIEVNGRTFTSESEIKNRNNYIQNKTIIYNKYGSVYTFYAFSSDESWADPFGYIK